MENMERFTPLYAIAYVILNGTENLRFDKDGYFDAVIFYGLFYKGNRKHFLRVPIRYGNTWKFGRTRNSVEKLAIRDCVPTSISRCPKLSLVFL